MISEGGSKGSVPDSTFPVPMVMHSKRMQKAYSYQYYHQDTSGCIRHSCYGTIPHLRFVWPCAVSHNLLRVWKLTSPKRRVCVKLNNWDASWLWPCCHHWRFLGVWQPRPWKCQLNPDRWKEWNPEQERAKFWQNYHNASMKLIYVTHGKGILISKGYW